MDLRRGNLRIVHGNSNPALARDVCSCLNIRPCDARVGRFANGETDIKILESIRGDDIFVFQPTCSSEGSNVNQAVMELLLLIHTMKLSSARRVVAVIPHYGYARQDRKHASRVPISASAVAKMIVEMGVDGVVTVDLHCGQIQGFFHGCPIADLNPAVEFAEYAKTKQFDPNSLVVVAPDAGAVTRARRLGDRIGASRIVTILKRRVEANKVDSMQLVGEVNNCVCIIVDDMIDTGGTLCKAADVLKSYGAKEVHAWATHGILTDPACQRIMECDALVEVVVTDSIPQEQNVRKCPKIKIISIAELLAEAIRRIHHEESMEYVRQRTPQMAPAGGTYDEVDGLDAPLEEDEW
eukprot:CAMPEP_0176421222 /NCGR_PEP_ID=MMETSP0127-20121128/9046_1 /TAXON_ID=938130 /ORGANISM="Platyophrya macrostoma, Strain WH" /LENGTH=352 /DNA_ID=CAMNT_0017801913 /DNA_START=14 /DNA_END=1069 /DNA_ORIENTATION=+